MSGILINSLPKSGTNLLQKTLELNGFSFANLALADSLLLGKYYYIRQLIRGALFQKNPVDIGLTLHNSISSKWLDKKLTPLKENHYLTGHANYSDRLKYYLDKNEVRIIQIIRDPRDVVVSWTHYVDKRKDMKYHTSFYKNTSFDDRLLMVLNGGYDSRQNLFFNSFQEILRRTDPWTELEDVCLVKFEDLIGNKGGGDNEIQRATLQKIIDFLGSKNQIDLTALGNQIFGGTHTFRKGQIGGWKEEVDAPVSELINSKLHKYILKWGYEL